MAAQWVLLDAVSVRAAQAPTETPPALATDGMPLDDVIGLTIWLDAGVGNTITADVGQVDIWVYDVGLWGLAPALVLAVPTGSAGQRRAQLGSVAIDNQRGRVAPILNGVSVSGGLALVDCLITLDRRGIAKAG